MVHERSKGATTGPESLKFPWNLVFLCLTNLDHSSLLLGHEKCSVHKCKQAHDTRSSIQCEALVIQSLLMLQVHNDGVLCQRDLFEYGKGSIGIIQ